MKTDIFKSIKPKIMEFSFYDLGREFIKIFIPSILLIIIGFVVIIKPQIDQYTNSVILSETALVQNEKYLFETALYSRLSEAYCLSEIITLQLDFHELDLRELTNDFLIIAKNFSDYDRVRFLNKNGVEEIRIDQTENGPQIVPVAKLPDKSTEDYFNKAVSLRGGVYVSPLELNIENGIIETPYKPIIRFLSPVYSATGELYGVVVLNYNVSTLIQSISAASQDARGNLYLFNDSGYWLVGPRPEDNWAFMFDDKKDRTLINTHPEWWKATRGATSHTAKTRDDLLCVEKINIKSTFHYDPILRNSVFSENWYIINSLSKHRLIPGWLRLSIVSFIITATMVIIISLLWSKAKIQQKQMLTALKESQETFLTISKSIREAIVIIDSNEIVKYWSSSAEKLFGFTKQEIVGQKIHNFIATEEDYDKIQKGFDRFKDHGDGYVVNQQREMKGKKKDGTIFDVEIAVSAVYKDDEWTAIGLVRDITEQKKKTERLLKLSIAMDQTVDMVFITDNNGTIEYINQAFEKITGYTQEESIGMNPKILKSGKMSEDYYKELYETLESGHYFHGEIINKKKNGELFYYEQTITPIKDKQGKVTHYISTGKDISDRKRYEAELVRAKENAIASERVKTLFIANMSHEIRTPLNGIIGYSNLLGFEMEEAPEDRNESQIKEFIQYINESGFRLMRTVESMIDLSLLDAGAYKPTFTNIDMNGFLAMVVDKYKVKAKEKSLEFTYTPSNNTVHYRVDEQGLARSLQHIFDNVIEYTNEGAIKVKTFIRDDKYIIMISDTGIGIAPAYMKRLFEPYSQESEGLAKGHQGIGLGLAVSKRFLNLMNAEIDVRSKKEEGTTIELSFPL